MFDQICRPAFIYLIVACIIALVVAFFNLQRLNMASLLSQFSSILLCTLILMGLCTIEPALSWAFTIIFILLALSGSIGMIQGWTQPSYGT
ncbi:Hypothetical protein KVN_LOCUS151 [uncultured virus]|nr:Hypothetical protein KVN_LOCUS151 [uncultured virus]